jgi:aspartate--ammonia ligase
MFKFENVMRLLVFLFSQYFLTKINFINKIKKKRNNSFTMSEATSSNYMAEEKLPPLQNREANSTHRFSRLGLQIAITDLKRFVEMRLEKDLNVIKHTSPMAFLRGTGVNDELDGTESKSAVRFTVPNQDIPRGLVPAISIPKSPYEMECEVVQSLAKWKRIMLGRLNCQVGQGIYCDSTSIRKGYKGDTTHSIIADQWDFEVRIEKEHRTIGHLKNFVKILWKIVVDAEDYIIHKYPQILLEGHPTSTWRLPKEITFLTSDELHLMFPNMDVHERETAAVRKFKAIFILGMGWPLKDGSPAEEVRSPGYDDWNMNGDILVCHPITEYRHELSSMGIRVDKESLLKQLEHRKFLEKERHLQYFEAVIDERLPFSYGGGIGVSRLLMLLLRTGHIGEVQVGLWHDEHYRQTAEAGIDMIPDRIIHYNTAA